MNEEQARRANHALRLYGEWLTMWMRHGSQPDPDTPEVTASSFTYEILYDSIDYHVDDLEAGIFQACRVIMLTCDYGDDGGGTDLMCFYEKSDWDSEWDDLRHILQGFDTNLTMIYRDGNFDPNYMPKGGES